MFRATYPRAGKHRGWTFWAKGRKSAQGFANNVISPTAKVKPVDIHIEKLKTPERPAQLEIPTL